MRSIELVEACNAALRLIAQYEAPRGMLYHRYTIDSRGMVMDARLVPPTAQNQRAMEQDLTRVVAEHLDLPDRTLQWQCEQAIRNYGSLHLVRHALPRADDRPPMRALFAGIGNRWRRDDGVGPALGDRLRALSLPGLTVADAGGDAVGLIQRWAGTIW